MNGCVYRTKENICEFWSDKGKGIVSRCDYEDCEDKLPSNADRIRAMSDEELATWLNTMQSNAWHSGGLRKTPNKYPSTNQAWLDWLRAEVDNGT